MHLADAFIQSDLHCIQVTVLHFIISCFPWESNPWSWRCQRHALPFELQESWVFRNCRKSGDFIKSSAYFFLKAFDIKAAVRNFCLFVAISVWKPGIAVSCRIIFRAWGCDPVFRHGSSADESKVLRSMCVSLSVTAPVWIFTVLRNHRF